MSASLKPPICCGTQVNVKSDAEKNGKTGVGLWCGTCNSTSWGADLSEAIAVYVDKHKDKITPAETGKEKPMQNDLSPATGPKQGARPQTPANKPTSNLPTNPHDFALMVQSQESRLTEIMSPIVSGDQSAVKLLITKNLRYVENCKKISKAWTTPEGQASIIAAVEEVFMMGACLGENGDLILYGDIVEFNADVEAFQLVLTNGKNAPFDTVEIELIHENDTFEIGRKDGDFKISLDMGIPRDEVIAVAVYGLRNKTGKVEGEVYDEARLMKKAEEHSPGYQKYLRQVAAFDLAKSEGRVSTDSEGREYATVEIQKETEDKYFAKDKAYFFAEERAGRLMNDGRGEYATQTIPKKAGGTWDKKIYRGDIDNPGVEKKIIYRDELSSPWAGADRPEMLRKMAGKIFMRKYYKTRNSEAAMEEVRTSEKMVDDTLNMGESVFDVDS